MPKSHAQNSTAIQRPLSPHLSIYRWQITMVMSITHRLTGIVLAVGTIGLSLVIFAVLAGAEAYSYVEMVTGTIFGKFVLFIWSLCLYYHLMNGIRHLFWDIGIGFSLKSTYISGYIAVGCAVLLTVATWLYAMHFIL